MTQKSLASSTKFLEQYGMIQIRLSPNQRLQVYIKEIEHPIHTHQFNLHSTVLYGEIHEVQFEDDGKTIKNTRRIKAGEAYFIYADIPHRVTAKMPYTVTLITEYPK